MFFNEINNIIYEREKRFKWLGKQSLDFYLPEYNIVIECQGIQHFKPINFFGGIIAFQQLIENDKRKWELLKKHNIQILYYTHVKKKPSSYFDVIYNNSSFLIKKILN